MINLLCKRIYDNPQFKKDYIELLSINLQNLINTEKIYIDSDVENRLLNTISIFSNSKDSIFKELALEILIKLFSNHEFKDEFEDRIFINLLSLALCNLGNFPSNEMLLKDKNENYIDIQPQKIWIENEYKKLNNTVIINKKKLLLTNSQINMWNSLINNTNVIVSAPTSAGKSFVLQNFIINLFNNKNPNKVVYIVPTRALIDQVSSSLKELLTNNDIVDVYITGVPIESSDKERVIYVVTQERAQILIDNNINFNYLFVDEAQNINDNARGVTLQSVIENVKGSSLSGCIFATPFVNNPEIFKSFMTNDEDLHIVQIKESPVVQNLYDVRIVNDNTCNITIIKDGNNTNYNFEFDNQFDEIKNFTKLAVRLGKNSINIIYGSTPSTCEKISQLLLSEIVSDNNIPEKLQTASNFIKQVIHEDYLLAETIKYGIVYHYGNLPAVIRTMIEDLCKSGDIKYIVCTSTLLQGVNLPAQNIFLFKPTKGSESPLSSQEFWNLVGRAGRLTKDFEGNVFLVNLNDWADNPLNKNKYSNVSFSFETYLKNYDNGLKQFILNIEHPSDNPETQGYENTLNKLFFEYKNNTINETLSKFNLSENRIQEIINDVSSLDIFIKLPINILNKNPNVSFLRQQELYNFLFDQTSKGFETNLIPLPPQKSFNDIYNWYLLFIKQLLRFLKKSDNNSYKYATSKLLFWMQGMSYKELLSSAVEYKNTRLKRGVANVNTEARNLFQFIERDIRYSYVKMTKCYIDLLAYIFETTNKTEYILKIPKIHLYLELGACSETQILLLSLGLSRTAAIEISKNIMGSFKSAEDIKNYLKSINLKAIGLSDIVINEIKKFIL
ncbi:MAG: DEAD/DEAH box helicase [Clostridia bacterium]|nr:DEAD/DEAH box helicase [Clostridia bacterium]